MTPPSRRRGRSRKFPLLVDGDVQVMEATSVIEYCDGVYPGPTRFIPADPAAAREVRMLDRIFDNYVMGPMNEVVADALKPAERRDPVTVADAKAKLDTIYAWLDARMAGREWAVGDGFTLADCAAAPSLFYADWVHPNDGRFPALAAYRARLLARPSVKRCVDDARRFAITSRSVRLIATRRTAAICGAAATPRSPPAAGFRGCGRRRCGRGDSGGRAPNSARRTPRRSASSPSPSTSSALRSPGLIGLAVLAPRLLRAPEPALDRLQRIGEVGPFAAARRRRCARTPAFRAPSRRAGAAHRGSPRRSCRKRNYSPR